MIKKLYHKYVIWRFTDAAGIYGDMVSYANFGKPIGIEQRRKDYDYWKHRFESLGYEAPNIEVWIGYGGYGEPLPSDFPKLKESACNLNL